MKLFAFHVGEACLHVFATQAEALRHCAGSAGAAPDWLFFAGDGSPLRLEAGLDGACFLRPWASCSSCSLSQVLPFVRELHGDSEGLDVLCQLFGAEIASKA